MGGRPGVEQLVATPEAVTGVADGGAERDEPAGRSGYASPAALFREHHDRLVRVLAVAYGDREAAADAVQEAFVQLYLNWERISTYEDPAAWVRRVAINRLRNERRSLRRMSEALRRLVERQERSGVEGTPGPDAQTADLADLIKAIRLLPPRRRLILALFYLDDLSIKEIARSLDISEGSVKRQLHDGREELRRRLGIR